MKQCIDSYIDPLTLLINHLIQQGVFLAELKLARVIPLYKGDNKQLIHNYIPISVLPFLSRIFEKKNYLNMSYVFLITIILCTRIKNKTVEDRVHICGENLVNVNNTKFLCVN